MIVERLTVRNWRQLRDEHRFTFEEGLNLLVGPNEAGKSTLFEVLQRLLFDRHGGKSQEILAMQPLGSSLAPEAELVLRNGEGRVRIRKRFLSGAFAELEVERNGTWEREHEGDAADQRIQELFEADAPGRGVSRGEHRGLAEALWFLQRESEVPDGDWNRAVSRGLQGLVEVAATSPLEEAVLEGIAGRYQEDWTPTGRLAAKSEISDLEEELGKVREEIARLQGRREEAQRHRERLEHLDAEHGEKGGRLQALERESEALRETIRQAAGLEADRERLREAIRKLEDEVGRLERDRAALERADEQIAGAGARLEDARGARRAAEEQRTVARNDAADRRRRLEEEVEPAHRRAQRRLKELRALRETLRLREELDAVEGKLEQVAGLEAELAEIEGDLESVAAPDAEELGAYEGVVQDLELARVRSESAAIRVRFDLDEDRPVTADPAPEREEGDWLVTRRTRFRIEGVGAVTVQGGGADLEELAGRIGELEERRASLLARFGAADTDELRGLHRARAELERKRERVADRREQLGREGDLDARAQQLRADLREAEAGPAELPEEERREAADDPARAVAEAEAMAEKRERELASAREALDRAETAVLAATERSGQGATAVATAEQELDRARRDKAELLGTWGTRERLEETLAARRGELEEARKELADVEERYRREVLEPRERRDALERALRTLREDVAQIERDRAGHQSAIETIVGGGLLTELQDLELEAARLEARLPVLRRRADAAKLLKELVDRLKEEQAEAVAGPLAERVGAWLSEITGDAWDRLRLDERLQPVRVRSTRYQEDLELSELSHGTREQVVVLLRLAIGALLSEERRHLVVLDDRLVNADPVRIRRLHKVLEEVCGSCQVLLATCNDTPYAGLGAHVIRVPGDGREAVG